MIQAIIISTMLTAHFPMASFPPTGDALITFTREPKRRRERKLNARDRYLMDTKWYNLYR